MLARFTLVATALKLYVWYLWLDCGEIGKGSFDANRMNQINKIKVWCHGKNCKKQGPGKHKLFTMEIASFSVLSYDLKVLKY